MNPAVENPNIRRGQFLWMDSIQKRTYIEKLTKRIAEGYYFSDRVISQVVEELAPVFNDNSDTPTA